jgi:hypothetical protein
MNLIVALSIAFLTIFYIEYYCFGCFKYDPASTSDTYHNFATTNRFRDKPRSEFLPVLDTPWEKLKLSTKEKFNFRLSITLSFTSYDASDS